MAVVDSEQFNAATNRRWGGHRESSFRLNENGSLHDHAVLFFIGEVIDFRGNVAKTSKLVEFGEGLSNSIFYSAPELRASNEREDIYQISVQTRLKNESSSLFSDTKGSYLIRVPKTKSKLRFEREVKALQSANDRGIIDSTGRYIGGFGGNHVFEEPTLPLASLKSVKGLIVKNSGKDLLRDRLRFDLIPNLLVQISESSEKNLVYGRLTSSTIKVAIDDNLKFQVGALDKTLASDANDAASIDFGWYLRGSEPPEINNPRAGVFAVAMLHLDLLLFEKGMTLEDVLAKAFHEMDFDPETQSADLFFGRMPIEVSREPVSPWILALKDQNIIPVVDEDITPELRLILKGLETSSQMTVEDYAAGFKLIMDERNNL